MITIVCILGGLLLIYRGQQTIDYMYKFNGTVTNMKIKEFQSGKSGLAYSLDFEISETDKIYGIYLGTKDQEEKSNTINKIEVGKTYTFYIDQTVSPSFDGHTLGIREIKNNEKVIYKDNSNINYIGGSIFLTMGILGLLILIISNRRNKNAL